MTLGIHGEAETRFRDGAFLADAGHHIGQHAALGHVIMHIVDGHEWRSGMPAQLIEQAEPARLVAAIAMHTGEEAATRRCARQALPGVA